MKINPILIIILGIILTLITPYLFTQFHTYISFGKSNEIGDTIGGITSPIIGIMGAILVYYALNEQVTANNQIERQFESERTKEIDRLNKIKKLIIFDLQDNIIVQTELLKDELNEYINKINSNTLAPPYKFREYIHLNSNLFESLNKTDIYSAFNLDNESFFLILDIYRRVNYILKYDAQSFINNIKKSISDNNFTDSLINENYQLQLDSVFNSIHYIIKYSNQICSLHSENAEF